MHQGCPDDVQCSLGIKRYSKRGVLVHIKWIGGCAVQCSVFSGVQVVLRHWPSHSIKWTPAGQSCLGQRGIRWPTNLKPTGAKRHTRSSTHVNLQHGQQRQRRIRLVMVCPSNLLPYVFTNPPKNSSLCLYRTFASTRQSNKNSNVLSCCSRPNENFSSFQFDAPQWLLVTTLCC